jgi:Flp pilus assembly protein TadD
MKGNMKFTRAFVISSTISLLAIGGCAHKNDGSKLPASRSARTQDDSSFAAGAGRTPTAATSYSFAKILIAQGRDRDALYVLSHIIREHPKYLPAYNEMAGVYMRADRLDDAITTLQTALEKSPKDGVLHNNLGMCYLLKEQSEKALESFTRATELVPNSATFRSNRAAALALTAHDIEAESEFRTVLGTLQARQNVLALSRARDNRPAPATDEKRSSIDNGSKRAPAAAPAQDIIIPKAQIQPPAVIKTAQSTAVPHVIEPPAPAPAEPRIVPQIMEIPAPNDRAVVPASVATPAQQSSVSPSASDEVVEEAKQESHSEDEPV